MKNNSQSKLPIMMIGIGALLVVSLAYFYFNQSQNNTQSFNFISPDETKALKDDQPISKNKLNRINIVEANMVDGFPIKMNQYPGAKLVKSNEIVYDGKTSYSVEYDATGSVKKVLEFFIAQAERNNWKVLKGTSSNIDHTGEEQISFAAEEYKINIVAEIEDNSSKVEYVVDVIPN